MKVKTCQNCDNVREAAAVNRTILICDKKQGCEDDFHVVAAGQICGNWHGDRERPGGPVDDDGARYIPLTQGRFAVVDADDYERLIKHKWSCQKSKNNCYASRAYGYTRISMHRVIMKAPKGLQVDHIDGNGLNNRKSNLRLCTHAENVHNSRPMRNVSSKYKGVCWHKDKKKWCVSITKSDRRSYLGHFDDEIVAAREYDKKAKELFGEFAYLNFAECRD
ncbi:MAG: hypothetical protein FVQ85_06310 [Planctomycetes bacterium]|nr:hypothetical protein [Planctomycetota bacterium]